ncbi:NAD(P)H-binding protein [Nakamurella sp. YIM 132087]|uniref:NAD(P)H-binding protein n=1 Tax=Nakamurella alba TaxID=2665158 RepID=A0A7K1FNM6_9ACTN|nr:NAD(P)H-binding protein [Nakamurella alba]MTD15738.1 NAD(P)H-binding protein [Nakamurella alba]
MTTGTVLVTGGTGGLGREVVRLAREAGTSVRIASRRPAPVGTSPDEFATVDWTSGAGLLAALTGVTTVIHCASGSPSGERETMAALLEVAGGRPDPPHLVYISIVGVDRIPLGYYRAKLQAEQDLQRSGLPFSILRATQFHSLVDTLLRVLEKVPLVLPVPAGIRFQPIDTTVVAAALLDLAGGDPTRRIGEIGGPQVEDLADLATTHLQALGKHRRIVRPRLPGSAVRALLQGGNLTPEHRTDGPDFATYLARRRLRSSRERSDTGDG